MKESEGLFERTSSPVYSGRCPQSPMADRQAFQLWGRGRFCQG